jgi:hypothetical protein
MEHTESILSVTWRTKLLTFPQSTTFAVCDKAGTCGVTWSPASNSSNNNNNDDDDDDDDDGTNFTCQAPASMAAQCYH